MEKLVILNPHKEDFEVDVLRYFILGDANILLYTLNEHDDDGHVRLYVTKVKDKQTYPLTDEEWALVKDAIRATVNENKNGAPLSIRDLDYHELENLVVEHLKVFKLSGDVIELLGANKKEFAVKEKEPVIEPMAEEAETTDDFMDEQTLPKEGNSDYKSMYEESIAKNKKLQEELENVTLSYQVKYDQIKAILEGQKEDK